MTIPLFKPTYNNSWAIVVGINKYRSGPPLDYACNDAEGIAEVLRDKFSFPKDNIVLLTDKSATREKILSEFLAFANGKAQSDDRLIFFFAGHGYTQTGRRGEIGFLVPFDGDPSNLASLIRWDELTRNSELIPAKHVLFIMDACYGGLAVTRYVRPGSMRFAKDMLRRYSRQVLTAGKADETVSDSGGPRAGHSVFTGHLLDALDGAAGSSDGIITANGAMAYVYDRVAKDYQSRQTPHYGYLDGDGDMIFDLSPLEGLTDDSETDKDVLVAVPATSAPQENDVGYTKTLDEQLKELLSDPKQSIKLHDFVVDKIRRVIAEIGDNSFPVEPGEYPADEFSNRLERYENTLSDLIVTVILLARWANRDQRKALEMIFRRLPDAQTASGGLASWLGLRWYPTTLLMYAGGIAALSADNYENLAAILMTKIGPKLSGAETDPIIVHATHGMSDAAGLFKSLPGHERHYVPRSEYLFKILQPTLEDPLFLGTGYEQLFDRFEVLYALVIADCNYNEESGYIWAPPGRFGWKRRQRNNPFDELINEAAREQDSWPPLRAGFFEGSYERFKTIAAGCDKRFGGLNWV